MAYHTGKLNAACEVCGRRFVNEVQLRKHAIYHKEPKYSCDFVGCTKKFYAHNSLEQRFLT